MNAIAAKRIPSWLPVLTIVVMGLFGAALAWTVCKALDWALIVWRATW